MFYLAIDQQIQVRTLHPEDAEALFQLVEGNRSRLRPWIHPNALPKTYSSARRLTIESFLNSLPNPMNEQEDVHGYLQELDQYVPELNPPMEMGILVNELLVGQIMLGRSQENFTEAEFGYWIDVESEGRGIVTQCVSGLMDYAIDNMGIERFIIGCASENRRSSAIPRRLGYRLLAMVPDGEIVGDFIYDRLIYEMQSNAWRENGRARMQRSAVADSQSR